MAESFLTVAQIARLIAVPLEDAVQWVESARLPSRPAPEAGGRVVSRADLAAFLEANHMPPLPPEGSLGAVDQLLADLPAGLRERLEVETRKMWPAT